MRGRLGMLIGFGAGYVLGAKAGTDRYDQLRRLYENVLSSRTLREAKGKAKGAVETGFEQARDMATEGVSKIKGRGEDEDSPGLSVAPPPSH